MRCSEPTVEAVPGRSGAEPFKGGNIQKRMGQLDPEWCVVDEHRLEREFRFEDSRETAEIVPGDLARYSLCWHNKSFFIFARRFASTSARLARQRRSRAEVRTTHMQRMA